ncbi:hypothetical protein ABBQ38_008303 [Trebouxia sp. C0009 RCD-2024]
MGSMAATVADAAMVVVLGFYAAHVSSARCNDCGVACLNVRSMLSINALSWALVQHRKICVITGSFKSLTPLQVSRSVCFNTVVHRDARPDARHDTAVTLEISIVHATTGAALGHADHVFIQ